MSNICCAVGGLNPDEVMEDTWGHLNPIQNKTHQGTIDIAWDGGSDYLVVSWRLVTEDGEFVCSGPVFYGHSNDFALEVSAKKEAGFYRYNVDYRWNNSGPDWSINHVEKIG